MVTLLISFQELEKNKEYQRIYKPLGIDGYFNLPSCEVSLQRAHKLTNLLDEDKITKITNKYEKKVQFPINEHIFGDALHFKEGYEEVSRHLSNTYGKKVLLHMARNAKNKAKAPVRLSKLTTGSRTDFKIAPVDIFQRVSCPAETALRFLGEGSHKKYEPGAEAGSAGPRPLCSS